MNRSLLLVGLFMVLSLFSCAREDQRPPAYNEKQCPMCTQQPGVCTPCKGTGKCSYCNGTGKRVTGWASDDAQKIKKGSYDEACPFCRSTGKCSYCDGTKKCWACKGTGKVATWDFYK